MDGLYILLLIAFLVFLLGGALCGWLAWRQIGALRGRIVGLEHRMAQLQSEETDADTHAEPDPAQRPASRTTRRPLVPLKQAQPVQRPKPVTKARPKSKPRARIDLETLLGAKGSVWIGGLALLLGAVFLLRYSIEAGLLSPLMRVSLAALMGVVALALSEWLARRDLRHPLAQSLAGRADIPAILAAIGLFSLFGAVYAAHALYGLLGTQAAFFGMAVVALGGMGLSLRRGPWIAGIGLIGALSVPLLVASVTPSFVGVIGYVALICGAALWVAARRGWRWLIGAAAIGATVWLAILSGKSANGLHFGLWAVGLLAVIALTLRALRAAPPLWAPWTTIGWAGVVLLMGLASAALDDFQPISDYLPLLVASGLLLFSLAGDPGKRWLALLIGGSVLLLHSLPFLYRGPTETIWPLAIAYGAFAVATVLAALRLGERLPVDRHSTTMTLLGGILAGWLLSSALTEFLPDRAMAPTWGLFSLAGLLAVAVWMSRRQSVARGAIWAGLLAWVAASAQLDDLWLSSLLLSLGILWTLGLALRRDDLWVRLAPLGMAAMAGLVANHALERSATYISATPFTNELWLYFALPGALTGLSAVWLGRRRDDLAAQGLLGGTVVFGLLFIGLQIHHLMNAGDLTANIEFESLAVQLLVLFAALFGSSWLRDGMTRWPGSGAQTSRYILPGIAILISLGTLAGFVLGQGIEFNPLLNDRTIIDGHPAFNSLLLAYFAPALLLGLSALRFAGRRPVWFVRVLGGLAGLSWLMWTTAQIRRFAQGEVIAMDVVPWDNGELYAVSAVWLLTGLALLLAGLRTGRRDLRLASAALTTLTTLKVFLIDMDALDGAFRALSFIGLGIALIGIGRLYQTVLSRPDLQAGPDADRKEAS